MLSVVEPDGAENFSIGQIIQVRELKILRSGNRSRLDTTKTYYRWYLFKGHNASLKPKSTLETK